MQSGQGCREQYKGIWQRFDKAGVSVHGLSSRIDL
jgi:hypothetical protein